MVKPKSMKIDKVDDLDIKDMTPDELQGFQDKLNEIRQTKIIDELVRMKNEFVHYCEENHLDLSEAFELAGFTNGGVIRKAKPKYKDPETGKLWAGRGKTPIWFKNRIKEGYSKEELEVK